MMELLGYLAYTIGTRLYYVAIAITSLFSHKARLMQAGRKNWRVHISQALKNETREKIWFHCASLGEFEQARPLIEWIKKEQPHVAVLVTFFSPSGYEIRKNDALPDYIFYLPYDTYTNARDFIELTQPSKAVFVKYELWHHYIKQLNLRHIKTYLICANFTPNHTYFKWYGSFMKRILCRLTHIFCQYSETETLLRQHGFTAVSTTGDTRFDRVFTHAQVVKPNATIAEFAQHDKLMIGGSSYLPEETILKDWLDSTAQSGIKLIVAPHQVNEQRVLEIEHVFGAYPTLRYTQASTAKRALSEYRVLILDCIGVLADAYQYATYAFVGGGFGNKGMHNTLEPAAFGCAIYFGPNNHNKFPETHLLIQAGIATTIKTAEELITATQANDIHSVKAASAQLLNAHKGSSHKIYRHLFR